MTGRPDGWTRWTTTGCVALLALIAATVSYLHMHMLVALLIRALDPAHLPGTLDVLAAAQLAEPSPEAAALSAEIAQYDRQLVQYGQRSTAGETRPSCVLVKPGGRTLLSARE